MKTKTYIGVMHLGRDQGEIRFVTSTENRMAHWEAKKTALQFSEQTAKDIVEALYCNGYNAIIIKAPAGMTLTNP